MKILAINCSPHTDKGNTAVILNPFLEGMKEQGSEIEVVCTKKLNINPCIGCFSCWTKTPGACVQKDDMEMLLPKLRDADLWVFATPVYWATMRAPMKTLMERILPLTKPFIELHEGHSRHSMHEGAKKARVVLVSTCGWWEMDNFDPLLVHIKTVCNHARWELAGAVLRPHAPVLKAMQEMGKPVDDIITAAKEAGRQLARDGKIREETLKAISRPLVPQEAFVKNFNERWT